MNPVYTLAPTYFLNISTWAVLCYVLYDWKIGVRFALQGRVFICSIQIGCRAHWATYLVGTGGSYFIHAHRQYAAVVFTAVWIMQTVIESSSSCLSKGVSYSTYVVERVRRWSMSPDIIEEWQGWFVVGFTLADHQAFADVSYKIFVLWCYFTGKYKV